MFVRFGRCLDRWRSQGSIANNLSKLASRCGRCQFGDGAGRGGFGLRLLASEVLQRRYTGAMSPEALSVVLIFFGVVSALVGGLNVIIETFITKDNVLGPNLAGAMLGYGVVAVSFGLMIDYPSWLALG